MAVATEVITRPVEGDIDEVIDRRRVVSVYQPLVHLATGEVVGYEALSRGPAGTPLESPMAMFDAAQAAGRTGELDWVCRAGGLAGALAQWSDPSVTWFVNVEPDGLSAPCPPDLLPALAAGRQLRVVVELTERHVERDPAALLDAAALARSNGWGVALDDVGANPSSLALLPFVQPDVVKLDLSLVQGLHRRETSAVANAVRAYSESTGAAVLAEGIEGPEMVARAEVLGATYGQGWHFGRPGSLPRAVPATTHGFRFDQRVAEEHRTPFEVAAAGRSTRRATKSMLLPNSLHLERQAMAGDEVMVVLSTFQDGRHLTPGTLRRYQRLAERNCFTALLGTRMPPFGAAGVRIVDLDLGDPLAQEWNVVVVGPHFAGALVARDCGDDGPDPERRFDYVITHDRYLVLRIARAMLRWVTSPSPA